MKEILDKILSVSNDELDQINTEFISNYNFFHDTSYFNGKSSREHYRLLIYVSSLFSKQTLFDIGTYRCVSAAALSANFKNKVISYDLIQVLPSNPILPNVEYAIGNCTLDKRLKDSPFMFFDVGHDGTFEKIFYVHLKSIEYKGFVMCDDIHLNDPMKEWWKNITEEKYDLSSKGHWSGTGLIYFK
jgi:hypothetical protein